MPQLPKRFKHHAHQSVERSKSSRDESDCSSDQNASDQSPDTKCQSAKVLVLRAAQLALPRSPMVSFEDGLLPVKSNIGGDIERCCFSAYRLPHSEPQKKIRAPATTKIKPFKKADKLPHTRRRRSLPVNELVPSRATSSDGLLLPSVRNPRASWCPQSKLTE